MSGVNEIRATFLDYFAKNGHEVVSSSPLVPRNDPTLMFANSGMVQFKNLFTGLEKRDYVRATTAQKCVRAGGKHNDLDNVGYTARHHTFFEMLGNFSFGDYFKEQAIHHAWTLITKEFGLDAKRLLVTVYADDDEAYGLWQKIAGLTDRKIIRIGTSDNFWQMGDTGPCGPCSEIFFDHGDHIWGGPPGSAEEDGDRFIEIWNLVFMQYEQTADGVRTPLPKPSIDTGMGLERVAAVLQGVHDNYDIDLFRTLIRASVEATGVAAEGDARASHRVIADHLRAMSFLIADGVLPSNEGRGYVLRRIMRRAMRHAHLLGARDPLMARLVPALIGEMGRAYPELLRAEALITETLDLEEKRFRRTLERGLGLLDEATREMKAGDMLDGETAFKLYDTYGFPLDLTQDALRRRDIHVNIDGFQDAMARQRAEARASWAGSGEASSAAVWFGLKERVGATEFLGYETETAEGAIVGLVAGGAEVTAMEAGESGAIVVNQTPFYAESGGQVGDIGVVQGDGFLFTVEDTRKEGEGLFVHVGRVETGRVTVDAAVTLRVDGERRRAIRANHSATHILHEALREVLGDHVAQKGSSVDADRLRFDFSHPKPLSVDEIARVEAIANDVVLQNAEVSTRLLAIDDAIACGARALFGEKYGDEVRVVSMGRQSDGNRMGRAFSVELCGGTHVTRTGDIGVVSIVAESAVAAGVRRLEALTARGARRHLVAQDQRVRDLASFLKVQQSEVVERVEAIAEDRRKLERELGEAKKKLAMGGGDAAAPAARKIGALDFVGRVVSGISPKDLKGLVDEAKKTIDAGVVAIVGLTDDGKAGIVVGVAGAASASANAIDLVKLGSEVMGGKGGGGRPDMAQAGGPDGSKAEDAIEAIARAVAARVG